MSKNRVDLRNAFTFISSYIKSLFLRQPVLLKSVLNKLI